MFLCVGECTYMLHQLFHYCFKISCFHGSVTSSVNFTTISVMLLFFCKSVSFQIEADMSVAKWHFLNHFLVCLSSEIKVSVSHEYRHRAHNSAVCQSHLCWWQIKYLYSVCFCYYLKHISTFTVSKLWFI